MYYRKKLSFNINTHILFCILFLSYLEVIILSNKRISQSVLRIK